MRMCLPTLYICFFSRLSKINYVYGDMYVWYTCIYREELLPVSVCACMYVCMYSFALHTRTVWNVRRIDEHTNTDTSTRRMLGNNFLYRAHAMSLCAFAYVRNIKGAHTQSQSVCACAWDHGSVIRISTLSFPHAVAIQMHAWYTHRFHTQKRQNHVKRNLETTETN